MHMMIAVERLHNDGVPTRLAVPTCDRELGEQAARQNDRDRIVSWRSLQAIM